MSMTPLLLTLGLVAAPGAGAATLSADDFRVYCGWLAAVEEDEVKGLSRKKQLNKVSKMAKMPAKKLGAVVKKGEKAGSNCADIAKAMEAQVRGQFKDGPQPMVDRVDLLTLDIEDPSHVVAYVTWRVEDPKKVEEEAATAAWAVISGAPIVTTLSMSAKRDGLPVFEGLISANNARLIDKGRINSLSDGPYAKFFEKAASP